MDTWSGYGNYAERKAVHLICDEIVFRPMQGARVLILSGRFKAEEGICLGENRNGRWAISLDDSDEVLSLIQDREFGLLIDLPADPIRN